MQSVDDELKALIEEGQKRYRELHERIGVMMKSDAITNYTENGHEIRAPSGNDKRRMAKAKAMEAAEKYVKEISEMLEG